jgi:hypothetical protein
MHTKDRIEVTRANGSGEIMRKHIVPFTLALASLSALAIPAVAGETPLGAVSREAVTVEVRHFMLQVAQDVTEHGPTAWRAHFTPAREFFMAVNGHLAFADSDAATRGIAALPTVIKHIELTWGDALRIDPLTSQFAVVASPYSEVQIRRDGTRFIDHGYFTALAERRAEGWMFRDAHWSSASAADAQ